MCNTKTNALTPILTYGVIYVIISLDDILGSKYRVQPGLNKLWHNSVLPVAPMQPKTTINAKKASKTNGFQGFLVEISGIEPLTS